MTWYIDSFISRQHGDTTRTKQRLLTLLCYGRPKETTDETRGFQFRATSGGYASVRVRALLHLSQCRPAGAG